MDPVIALVLVLSALFLGALAWLAVYSRRQQSAAVRTQQPSPPGGKNLRRPPAPDVEKVRRKV